MFGMGCMECGGGCGMGDGEALDVSEGGTYLPPDGGGETFFSGAGYTPDQLTAMGYSPASGYSAVTQTNPATLGLLSQLAAQWTNIAGQAIAPQTTIHTANGTQIQTPAGQTSALSNLFGGAALGTSSSGVSILPLLAIAGVGLFLISRK